MAKKSVPLSVSVEDYLKAIYGLTEGGGAASTSAIAEALTIQPASVSGMIKRLDQAGYLRHVPYRGVTLTEQGTREALRVIRRHRILETYLCTRLGYTWDDVHTEAESLEHAASDTLIERMAEALEDPSHDPHGAPIPTAEGTIETALYPSLAEATGDHLVIRAVKDDDPDRLRYLQERDMAPGTHLRVVDRAPFTGPITVKILGSRGQSMGSALVLGNDLARCIFVDAPAG